MFLWYNLKELEVETYPGNTAAIFNLKDLETNERSIIGGRKNRHGGEKSNNLLPWKSLDFWPN